MCMFNWGLSFIKLLAIHVKVYDLERKQIIIINLKS